MLPSLSPAPDPGQIATSVITWSGFVLAGFTFLLTVFTAFVLLAGVLGLREIRNIRSAGRDVRDEANALLTGANELLAQLREEIATIQTRMNSVVEVGYLFSQGQLAYREGAYLKAVDFLGRAATLDPKNSQVLYRLGRALTNAGDDVAAPDRFKEMKELGPQSGAPERGLAYVYRYSNANQALEYARAATTFGPGNHANWNCLGIIQRDVGDVEAAIRSHQKAADLEPNSVVTPFFLSLLRARGSAERARDDCRAAVYRLKEQESRSPVKSIWSDLILWTDRIFAGAYDEADALCESLAQTCTSRRRAREIGGHMDFMLRALKRESFLVRYLRPIEERWPPQPGE